jgi:hypothetical protein
VQITIRDVSAEQVSMAIDEADVEASTPAEEASLHDINRTLRLWLGKANSGPKTGRVIRLSKRTSRLAVAQRPKHADSFWTE